MAIIGDIKGRGEARSSGMTYAEVLQQDTADPPAELMTEAYEFVDNDDKIAVTRYTTQEFHDLEAEKLWGNVWQMACRLEHIPEVGDHIVYEVCDLNIIVVRVGPDEVRAYHNSCLHRGTTLVDTDGNAAFFRCPFHGFSWNIDGTFRGMPAAWDFPHIDADGFGLPELAVAIWGGFVFVHPGDDPEPFEEFSAPLTEHFAPYPLENRYIGYHGCQVIDANWKAVHEAFLEGYHITTTHPHTVRWANDQDCQYDVFGPNVTRLLQAVGIPSTSFIGQVPEDEIAATMLKMIPRALREEIPEDVQARPWIAEQFRNFLGTQYRTDLTGTSDAEILDSIQYSLFPNFVPWGGFAIPITYRFRPFENDPNRSVMEIMLLFPIPDDGEFETAEPFWLEPGQSWSEAPGFKTMGMVIDQDMDNLPRVQRGLRAATQQHITLSDYQEIRIRHFNQRLDEQLDIG